MIRAAMLILLAILLAQGKCHAADLPALAVQKGKAYLHVREKTNHNDAPEIDRMLAYLGLPKGLSWCAAYSLTCYREASDELGVKQPFPRYGRVAMLWSVCKANPLKYKAITADEVRLGSVQLRPGDLPVWAHGTIKSGDFNGHTGLVIGPIVDGKVQVVEAYYEKPKPVKSFRSIEGNTQPGPGGNQREGGGVYERTRTIAPGSFRILGFCRAIK